MLARSRAISLAVASASIIYPEENIMVLRASTNPLASAGSVAKRKPVGRVGELANKLDKGEWSSELREISENFDNLGKGNRRR